MAEETKNLLTYEGHQKLVNELDTLKTVKRQEIVEKIKEARAQGDLSENAEYDAAKDEQRDNEARIKEIEAILKNCEVIVNDDNDTKTVNVGSHVKVRCIQRERDFDYEIVGATEASTLEGRISNESPVGKALIGARKNQVVTVATPRGEVQYKVLKIEKK
ncbi:MAG: transcription elongation factor GreA [Lachnospiraceae bacterium]|jgi:transcription elongation factor GreA